MIEAIVTFKNIGVMEGKLRGWGIAVREPFDETFTEKQSCLETDDGAYPETIEIEAGYFNTDNELVPAVTETVPEETYIDELTQEEVPIPEHEVIVTPAEYEWIPAVTETNYYRDVEHTITHQPGTRKYGHGTRPMRQLDNGDYILRIMLTAEQVDQMPDTDQAAFDLVWRSDSGDPEPWFDFTQRDENGDPVQIPDQVEEDGTVLSTKDYVRSMKIGGFGNVFPVSDPEG